MIVVCPKCGDVARADLVATAEAAEFRRCTSCQGMVLVRAQSPRGRVVRADGAEDVVVAAGELEGREQLEPSWYQAALARGAS